MNQEKIQRTIKLFRHREKEAEKQYFECKASPTRVYYAGLQKAYEFSADYLEANSQKKEIPAKTIEKIDKQIKENNTHVTAGWRVSTKAGKEAGLEADAKLKKLFEDLKVNPSEYAEQKLGKIKLIPLEPLEVKKVKMIQIQELEPECPRCRGSNAMLNEHLNRLKCRDCGYTVEKKDVEMEIITMKEGQSRLKKYGGLFKPKEEEEPQKVKRVSQLKLGDVLANGTGAILIAKREDWHNGLFSMVLCLLPEKREYVTWNMNEDGNTFDGRYFFNLSEASDDFDKR